MIKKDVYFIEVASFQIIKKYSDKTVIASSEGNCKSVDSVLLNNFKEGDYLFRSMMIGGGHIRIRYFKIDNEKTRMYFQKRGLENIFFLHKRN